MANRSTFPNQIDTFIEHVDISPFDIANVQRYQELKLKPNKTSAEIEELNNLTVLLRDKILTPEDFNKLQDAMVNIETFTKDTLTNYYKYMGEYNSTTAYKTFNSVMYNGDIYLALYDVQGILPTDTSKWLKISQKGDKGDKAFNWKGTYDNNTSYVVDDVVYYNGSSYVCIRNSTGHLPIDVAYWSPCALKGTDGVGFKFKGIWNSGYAYNLDDAVSYNNKIYYCIQGNIGQLPTNTDYWQEFFTQQTEAIQISINDVDGYYNATNVEDALKEIWETKETPAGAQAKADAAAGAVQAELDAHLAEIAIHKTSDVIRTETNTQLKVEVVSSSVSATPDAGRIIFDTSQGKFFGGNGTEWV